MTSYKKRLQQYDSYLSELIRDYERLESQESLTGSVAAAQVKTNLQCIQGHLREHFPEFSPLERTAQSQVEQSSPKCKSTLIQTPYPIRKIPYVPSATRGLPFRVQSHHSEESDYDLPNPGEKAVQLERRQLKNFNETLEELRRGRKKPKHKYARGPMPSTHSGEGN